MWVKISTLILRYRLAFLITLLSITAFMGYKASYVQLSYEFAKVLPDNDTSFTEYNLFKSRFGEDGSVLVIGLKDSDFFRLEKFNDWRKLSNNIKSIDGIEEVVSLARIFSVERDDSAGALKFGPLIKKDLTSQTELDSIRDEILSLPFYDHLLYNNETSVTLMAVTLDNKKLNTKSRIDVVDEIIKEANEFGAKHHLEMHYSGLPYIRTAITRKVANELVLFLLLAIAVTATILFIFFRSYSAVIFSLLVVIIGGIWSLGTIVLLGYKITILTGLIPPLIIVIGVPNCILLLNKYQVEYKTHKNKIKALQRSIQRIGMTTFLANITTAIGFGVFYFTHSRILMEFGLAAAMNVMATYFVSLILIPVVFSYRPAPSDRHIRHLKGVIVNKVLDVVTYWVSNYRTRIYIITSAVVIISIIGILKINTIGFIVDDLSKNDPIYTDLKFFETNFKGIMPFEVTIDTRIKNGVFEENAKALYKLKSLEKVFDDYPEFSKPVSILNAIKFAYQAYRDGNPKYYILPPPSELKKLRDYIANSPQQKKGTFHSFIDSSSQVTRFSIQVGDIGSVRLRELLEDLRPRVDSIFSPEDYNVSITGNSVIFTKGNEYLVKNLQQSVILAVVLISMIMILLFMSTRMITVSILPSVIPLVITAGLMGYFGIALKPSTILIFSIAFGIASDGTIYFLTKYRQELKLYPHNISKAVMLTIRETGVSMVYTSIVLFAGFAIFTASTFGGTAALGILISFTLLCSYCTNLILLPSILLTLEKRLVTKAFLSEPLIDTYDEEEDIEFDKLEIKAKKEDRNKN